MKTNNSVVNSYDEWSKLKEVIIGVGEEYNHHHLDVSFRLFYNENTRAILKRKFLFDSDKKQFEPDEYFEIPKWVLEELLEDIEGFVYALTQLGIIVHRPNKLNNNAEFQTPYWKTRPTPALNVRDQSIIIGDTIVETAMHVRGRYFENDNLKNIFYKYFKNGSNWISMPKPILFKESLDPSYFQMEEVDLTDSSQCNPNNAFHLGYEMIFDGAQCIRLGKDILVNVGCYNHLLGFDWLKRTFGDTFNFHKLDKMADNHIDSILLPLRPGLMLLRSQEYLKFLPKGMQKWDIIYPPESEKLRFPNYGNNNFFVASKYIDLNLLSLDENTVVVNSLYPELIGVLELKKFTVIPVQHRHRRLFGGGFHCFSLDCVREGGLENYL